MIRPDDLIDVWDLATFDDELRADLDAHADVIRDYMVTSRRQWLEREASDRTMPYPENPHAGEFIWVKEHIMRLMERRMIRAWHYTRLTDAEVAVLQKGGIYPSNLGNIRARLDAQVAAGAFNLEIAERLYGDSPYQSDQHDSRSGKFWMTSHPTAVDDGGVELLVESWGGEAVYFWQRDEALQDLLRHIGRARVLEIAMPLSYSRHGFSAAEAVVSTYGRTLGRCPDSHAFDLYSIEPLGPDHLLAIHSEGEPTYAALGRGYPVGYAEKHDVGDDA